MMNENENRAKTAVQAKAAQPSRVDTDLMGIGGAVLLGLMLLFAAGFAQATVLHDTAHDMRHAMAFPCH